MQSPGFEPAGFFMLRRALLPFQQLKNFHQKTDEDPDAFEAELIRLFSEPLLNDAIRLASPSLHGSLCATISGIGGRNSSLLRTLYKYLVRMCSRATPYGLFSGFAAGTLSESTKIRSDPGRPWDRITRLTTEASVALARRLLSEPDVLREARLFVNSSLFELGGTYRYVERIITEDGQRHLLSSLEADQLLKDVISLCNKGCTFRSLENFLTTQMPAGRAPGYIRGLIDMQILVTELEAVVTGPTHLEIIEKFVSRVTAAGDLAGVCKRIREILYESEPVSRISDRLALLIEAAENSAAGPAEVQTELKLNMADCSIRRENILLLSNEFDRISMLFEASRNSPDIEQFKDAFLRRYNEQPVPLMLALDVESGIGYGDATPGKGALSPLLETLRFPAPRRESAPSGGALADFRELLLARSCEKNLRSVSISDNDIASLARSVQPPSHFYWLGSILTGSGAQFDQGNFRFLLRAVGGSSGLELLGRFCHADDKLAELVRSSASKRQQHSGAILAEIAHLPDPGAAAVLSRPHLSDYEIVYLAGSSMPEERQIHASDLMVTVTQRRQVVLTSRRLGKRVIPTLSSAHNFSRGLPVYRFLCDLAFEQQRYQSWDWGHLTGRPFLPGLSYGHLVISRATWNLTAHMFPEITRDDNSFETRWKFVSRKLGIPRYFQICEHDRQLLIDGSNKISLRLLKEMIRKQGSARIVEFLKEQKRGLWSDRKKWYAEEIVVPFRPSRDCPSGREQIGSPQQVRQGFMTASNWLYVKIYSGIITSDRLLTELLSPYCEKLIKRQVIKKWFFVRYYDPDYHLRLRFFNDSRPEFWRQILKELNGRLSEWLNSGLVHKVQTDTYQREQERYPELAYERTESIFFADSQAAASLLSRLYKSETPEDIRWQLALAGADRLMQDLGIAFERKSEFAGEIYKHLLAETGHGRKLTVQLDRQFRSHRNLVVACMKENQTWVEDIFCERSGRIKAEVAGHQLSTGTVASFIHMFFNRIFASSSREQELVIYHYLSKYYKAFGAIIKRTDAV